ncbi:hypothetical protein ACI6PS_06455 [Flavobacterium sp. PLA-1-15]|uniref:hypothetical protein n=1 Tax=Flavobacterium sp. PLA-1-15 TaxID=3380533 RepID=UPI003B79A2B4
MLFISCGNDDNANNCLSYSEAYVESVESVENADAAGFLFKVRLVVMNGCGEFGSFEEIIGDSTTVKVIAKYEGCVCTEALEIKEAVYSFNPTASGTYTLRFKNSEDTFITKTVTVE